MRTEAGKMPECLIFPIRNGLGVSNDRFGLKQESDPKVSFPKENLRWNVSYREFFVEKSSFGSPSRNQILPNKFYRLLNACHPWAVKGIIVPFSGTM